MDRRAFLGGVAATAAAATVEFGLREGLARADAPLAGMAAVPPAGFSPMSAPGVVVRVKKAGSLEANGLFPKPEDAKAMLTRALQELSGKSTLASAVLAFIHPQDKVCVKVNGIALQNMASNKELVLPFVQAMVDAGVAPANITLLDQYPGFFQATRIKPKDVPAGVGISWHSNNDATMEWRPVANGRRCKFVRVLTEATALVNFSLVKDHSCHGFTGAMKNMTHGCNINPQDFHDRHGSPQIAILAAQDVLRSRLRLCILDGFKLMAHGGPLWKQPQYVIPHESVYAATDPVAVDSIGWDEVEKARATFGLKTLKDEGREPAYIAAAESLGVGVSDRKKITLRDVTL